MKITTNLPNPLEIISGADIVPNKVAAICYFKDMILEISYGQPLVRPDLFIVQLDSRVDIKKLSRDYKYVALCVPYNDTSDYSRLTLPGNCKIFRCVIQKEDFVSYHDLDSLFYEAFLAKEEKASALPAFPAPTPAPATWTVSRQSRLNPFWKKGLMYVSVGLFGALVGFAFRR